MTLDCCRTPTQTAFMVNTVRRYKTLAGRHQLLWLLLALAIAAVMIRGRENSATRRSHGLLTTSATPGLASTWSSTSLEQLRQRLGGSSGPLLLSAPLEQLRPSTADLMATVDDRAACEAAASSGRPLFRLHFLDPNTLLPQLPFPGNSTLCDLKSPEVWPHEQLWRGTEASRSTPHWTYQHAAGWWVRQALAESSAVHLVDTADEADIVLLDMHCLNTWIYAELMNQTRVRRAMSAVLQVQLEERPPHGSTDFCSLPGIWPTTSCSAFQSARAV